VPEGSQWLGGATRARYTLEFKHEAVPLVEGGQSFVAVAGALGMVEQTLFDPSVAGRVGPVKMEREI
jgi:transposase